MEKIEIDDLYLTACMKVLDKEEKQIWDFDDFYNREEGMQWFAEEYTKLRGKFRMQNLDNIGKLARQSFGGDVIMAVVYGAFFFLFEDNGEKKARHNICGKKFEKYRGEIFEEINRFCEKGKILIDPSDPELQADKLDEETRGYLVYLARCNIFMEYLHTCGFPVYTLQDVIDTYLFFLEIHGYLPIQTEDEFYAQLAVFKTLKETAKKILM